MEKALEGNLAHSELADLLLFFQSGRRTGLLVLEQPDQESKIFVKDGTPVFAATSNPEMGLGKLLVKQGRLEADLVAQLLARQRVSTTEQLLSETELSSLLKTQVTEVIFDAFTWREGLFSFWERVPPPPGAVILETDLPNLLMEAARRAPDRKALVKLFADHTLVPETAVNPERVRYAVTLTPEEWRIFFLIDGRRSLAEICDSSGSLESVALQTLETFHLARLLVLRPPPEPSAPSPSETVLKKPLPEAEPAVVAFSGGIRAVAVKEDTRGYVTPKAVEYMGSTAKVLVSRLVLTADGQETSFPLTRDSCTLGRHRNNDVVVADAKVSSFHARIDRTPEGYVVHDLGSRNGTYLNGRRIGEGLLTSGDELRFGTARLAYRIDSVSDVS
jgi:hypothetical protein